MKEKEIMSLLNQATKLEAKEDFAGALKLIRRARNEATHNFGRKHYLYVRCLHHTAICYNSKGNSVAARECALKGLEILNATLSSQDFHNDHSAHALMMLISGG